jgi:hypothetical protein
MQDYFASTAQTDDSRVLMSLMRHTNLTTTTTYIRAVYEHMKDAVKNLGKSGGNSKRFAGAKKCSKKHSIENGRTCENAYNRAK